MRSISKNHVRTRISCSCEINCPPVVSAVCCVLLWPLAACRCQLMYAVAIALAVASAVFVVLECIFLFSWHVCMWKTPYAFLLFDFVIRFGWLLLIFLTSNESHKFLLKISFQILIRKQWVQMCKFSENTRTEKKTCICDFISLLCSVWCFISALHFIAFEFCVERSLLGLFTIYTNDSTLWDIN